MAGQRRSIYILRTACKQRREEPGAAVYPWPNVRRKPMNDFLWGIELKKTHEVIGMIEVFDVENERSGMVSFRIDPQLWNEGFCTEAMKRVIDFFTETGMDRLQGNANVKNTGSNRVLKKERIPAGRNHPARQDGIRILRLQYLGFDQGGYCRDSGKRKQTNI